MQKEKKSVHRPHDYLHWPDCDCFLLSLFLQLSCCYQLCSHTGNLLPVSYGNSNLLQGELGPSTDCVLNTLRL